MLSKLGILVTGALCATPLLCAADSILLSDNVSIEGQVIRDTPGDPLVVINTGGKLLCLNRNDIGTVTLDDEGRAEYKRRRDAIKDKSAAPPFELYQWAKTQRLYDYADQELSATLKADPNHAEARKVLAAAAKPSKAAPDAAVAAIAEAPVIGPRPMTPAQRTSSDFDERVISYCKALMPTFTSDESSRKAALAALEKERSKAGDVMLAYLDIGKGGAEDTRLAALAGIEALKPVSTEASNRLAMTAMNDPSKAVRKQTAALIKSRNDEPDR